MNENDQKLELGKVGKKVTSIAFDANQRKILERFVEYPENVPAQAEAADLLRKLLLLTKP